jgi:hypothetical protein
MLKYAYYKLVTIITSYCHLVLVIINFTYIVLQNMLAKLLQFGQALMNNSFLICYTKVQLYHRRKYFSLLSSSSSLFPSINFSANINHTVIEKNKGCHRSNRNQSMRIESIALISPTIMQ